MIYLGDCIETMQIFIEDNSIDLTVTSPPYDNLRNYNDSLNWNFEIFKDVAKELYRVTKPGGIVVWVVGDATIKGCETGTSFKQALNFVNIGFNLHDTMIWNKGSFTAVGALVTRYAPVFEYMFILTKGKIKTFNAIKDRENLYANHTIHGTIRQKDGTTKPISSTGKGKKIPAFGQRHNIWKINPEKSKWKKYHHPAMFPEQLVHDHIVSWSNKSDIILDPFMGSGTTGKVAEQLNRKFIGIEKQKEYFEIAQRRLLCQK